MAVPPQRYPALYQHVENRIADRSPGLIRQRHCGPPNATRVTVFMDTRSACQRIRAKRLDSVHDDDDAINVDLDSRQREKLAGVDRPRRFTSIAGSSTPSFQPT